MTLLFWAVVFRGERLYSRRQIRGGQELRVEEQGGGWTLRESYGPLSQPEKRPIDMGQCWALVQFCLAHLIRELKFLAEHPNVMVQAYGQDLLRAVRGLFALIHQREELCPTPFQKQLEKQRRAMVRVATQTEYLSPIQRVRRSPPEYHGKVDSMPQYPVVPFNFGRPTVHDNGANVTLLDGHVERVGFKKRWEVEASKKVVHSFCYLED